MNRTNGVEVEQPWGSAWGLTGSDERFRDPEPHARHRDDFVGSAPRAASASYIASANSGRYLASPEIPSIPGLSSSNIMNASSGTSHSLRIP